MLPDFDNTQRWLKWFKTKKLFKALIISPAILIIIIISLINSSNQLKDELEKLKTEIIPIKELYPKLELSAAVAQLLKNYSDLEKLASPRIISPEINNKIVNNLKLVAPFAIEIRAVAGNIESINLSKQIKAIFEEAGWNVNWAMALFHSSIDSFLIASAEDPGEKLRKAIAPLFIELEYNPVIKKYKNIPANTLWIQVGSK